MAVHGFRELVSWRAWWGWATLATAVLAGVLTVHGWTADAIAVFSLVCLALVSIPGAAEARRHLATRPDTAHRPAGQSVKRRFNVWDSGLNEVVAAAAAHVPAAAIPSIAAQTSLRTAHLAVSDYPAVYWHNAFARAQDQGVQDDLVHRVMDWSDHEDVQRACRDYLDRQGHP